MPNHNRPRLPSQSRAGGAKPSAGTDHTADRGGNAGLSAPMGLAHAGEATVLSYNVPEPTSYPGRNYILLNLPDDYWRADIVGPAPAAPATIAGGVAQLHAVSGRPDRTDEAVPTLLPRGDDPAPPQGPIEIDYSWKQPAADLSVTSNSYQVSVIVEFDGQVTLLKNLRLAVNGADGPVLTAQSGLGHQYAAALTLTPGTYTLRVRGDRLGYQPPILVGDPLTITVVAATANVPPPTITVTKPTNNAEVLLDTNNAGQFAVQVSATSGAGMKSLLVQLDGLPVNGLSGGADAVSGTVPVRGVGNHTLTVIATDTKGGQASVTEAIVAKSATLRSSRFKLALVECVQLSSFLGSYGAGRVLQTFSLLPGEKTKISIQSYTSSEETRKDASSILDSYSTTQSDAFEQAVNNEQSTQTKDSDEAKSVVKASASASWGFGSVSASYDGSWASSSARDELVKNVRNATTKHAAEASAKRDVHIDSSTTSTDSTHTTTTTDREIANLNVSRTLNFVFRQMNQEFITLLHMTDVRIGLLRWDDDGAGNWVPSYLEVTLPQLDSLLRSYLRPDRPELVGEVRNAVFAQLDSVYPFQADAAAAHRPVSVVEQIDVQRIARDADGFEVHDANGNPVYAPSGTYFRFRQGMLGTYTEPETGVEFTVPGVLLAADRHVMRTDGIIVEAVLGQGEALDEYNRRLQVTAVEARAHDNTTKIVANQLSEEELRRVKLARGIVEKTAADKQADVYGELFPAQPTPESTATVTLAPVTANGSAPVHS